MKIYPQQAIEASNSMIIGGFFFGFLVFFGLECSIWISGWGKVNARHPVLQSWLPYEYLTRTRVLDKLSFEY